MNNVNSGICTNKLCLNTVMKTRNFIFDSKFDLDFAGSQTQLVSEINNLVIEISEEKLFEKLPGN